jgi:hypothetical protein
MVNRQPNRRRDNAQVRKRRARRHFFGSSLPRPLHRGEQLVGLALGAQPDFAGAPLGLGSLDAGRIFGRHRARENLRHVSNLKS